MNIFKWKKEPEWCVWSKSDNGEWEKSTMPWFYIEHIYTRTEPTRYVNKRLPDRKDTKQ